MSVSPEAAGRQAGRQAGPGSGGAEAAPARERGPGTYEKALRINLDDTIHGTFAEIGAGQEVARWFFHVGGAAATVAKTISAYDMAASDMIYGATDRYVSERRLASMLDLEYRSLVGLLGPRRGATTQFFVFADTMATRSYSHPEPGRGWMGVRFQHAPQAEPSELVVHVRILDSENAREQQAVGIFGVNLIYGCFRLRDQPHALIASLMDSLGAGRVEIDMIRFSGPGFAGVDNRLMSLQLVEQGFTSAAAFNPAGDVIQLSELLYKRPILVLRGAFRPVTRATLDLFRTACAHFRTVLSNGPSTGAAAGSQAAAEPVVVMEMTLRNLVRGGQVDHSDFLARVDILAALGQTVVVSSFAHHYALVEYLRRNTREPIALPMGLPAFARLFDEGYYSDLDGGILESFGRLFARDVTLYVYPTRDSSGQIATVSTLRVAPQLRSLYAYLLERRLVQPLEAADEAALRILPRDALQAIGAGDPSWEAMVPDGVAAIIKKERLFGYES